MIPCFFLPHSDTICRRPFGGKPCRPKIFFTEAEETFGDDMECSVIRLQRLGAKEEPVLKTLGIQSAHGSRQWMRFWGVVHQTKLHSI